MTKRSINPKEVQKIIQEKILANIPRQEILNELSEQYYDKNSISMMIASTVDPQLKKKYKSLNNILLVILVFIIISKIIEGIVLMSSLTSFMIPFAFVIPTLLLLLIFQISKFIGTIYSFVGLMAIAGIFQSISYFPEVGFFVIINIVLCLIVSILSFYLKKKLFPNLGLWGLKKDKEGNITLG